MDIVSFNLAEVTLLIIGLLLLGRWVSPTHQKEKSTPSKDALQTTATFLKAIANILEEQANKG